MKKSHKILLIIIVSIIAYIVIFLLSIFGYSYWKEYTSSLKLESNIRILQEQVGKNSVATWEKINEIGNKQEAEKIENQTTVNTKAEEEKDKTPSVASNVVGNKYINNDYKFKFTIPPKWKLESEEKDIGGDILRIYLTTPGFKEEVPPYSEDILSISVTDMTFDKAYEYMDYNVGKENEKKITVAGRKSVKRIGKHEFGGGLVVVTVPNNNNAIQLILRSNKEPYTTQFQTLLDSFKFIK